MRRSPILWPLLALMAFAAAAPAPAPRPAIRAGSLALPGLTAPVTLLVDRHGIDHLEASTRADLYRAWGYVTARDRLWQLVLARAQGEGTTHRWFGNEALQSDGGAQLLGLAERARGIWARDRADAPLREALEAYAAGINAHLAECRSGAAPWPPELVRLRERPRDWRPEDSAMLFLGLGLTLDLGFEEIPEQRAIDASGVARLAERRRFEDDWMYDSVQPASRAAEAPRTRDARAARAIPPEMLARAERAIGHWPRRADDGSDRASNVFAVGPGRSATGRPVLANDPHLALLAPGWFHVVHLRLPGGFEAAGGAVPGIPAIVSGRSLACAWGITALGADVIDICADSLSADGRQAKTASGWTPVTTESFAMSFRVLGVPLPIPTFVQARRRTANGPVLVWEPKRRLALTLRWSAFEDERISLRHLIGLEGSRTADEIAARARSLVTPTINVTAVDTLGTVLYQACGLVPKRWGTEGLGVTPGDAAQPWAYIPSDSMPSVRAARDGFVVNANNRPAGTSYPYALWGYDFAQDRAMRIHQRLAGDTRITAADLISVQADAMSRAAARQTPALIAAAESLGAELSPRARAAIDSLRGWDFVVRRPRVAATISRAWWGALIARSQLAGLAGLALAGLEGRADSVFAAPAGGASERPAVASVAALEVALDSLSRQLGPDPARWRWGRAHQARFRHGLARLDGDARWGPPLTPCDGDGSTPGVGGSRLPASIEVTAGPVFRHVADLAVRESSWVAVGPFNRAQAGAAERDRMRARWADHAPAGLLFDWALVERAAVERTRLTPR